VSYGIDVNILLYASDFESPMDGCAAVFLRRCVTGPEVFCLAWVSLMSYLRMATHPAIFNRPLTHEDAARNVEALLSVPGSSSFSTYETPYDVGVHRLGRSRGRRKRCASLSLISGKKLWRRGRKSNWRTRLWRPLQFPTNQSLMQYCHLLSHRCLRHPLLLCLRVLRSLGAGTSSAGQPFSACV